MNKSEINYIEQKLSTLKNIYNSKITNKYTTPAKKLTNEEKLEILLKAVDQKILPIPENAACYIVGSVYKCPLDSYFDFSSYETPEVRDEVAIKKDLDLLNDLIEETEHKCIFFSDKYPFPRTYEMLKQELEMRFITGEIPA